VEYIEYIKEKLNTLRVEFMANIFIIIALVSGLSKIILDTETIINNNQQFMFNLGATIWIISLINTINVFFALRKYNEKLKDIKWVT